ncbi:MAG: hypothetical protein JRF33_26670 [Deltaproteobacteria bacterium]|nr:hypothetical protein [Deltaproteobacteria bacterium]
MAFCPNPDCPARKRSRRPAEYRAGVERCADCGSLLIIEDPTEKEKPQRVVCPPALRWQIFATLGLTLTLIGLAWVPLPGSLIDSAALDGLFLGLPAVGLLSLGVTPFLLGFALTELFALAIPRPSPWPYPGSGGGA